MNQNIKDLEIKSIDDYRKKMKEAGCSSKEIEEDICDVLRNCSSEDEISSLLNLFYYNYIHPIEIDID